MILRELRPPAYVDRHVPDDDLYTTSIIQPGVAARLLMRYTVHDVPLSELAVEAFGVLLLDSAHHVIASQILTIGILDRTLVHAREVFRPAILHNTAGIIIFHNHPTGNPAPSSDDVAVTVKLRAVGVLMEIPVIDHIIVAGNRYHSFMEAGTL